MPNPGIAPPDYGTPVGQFRLLANDTASIPLNPVVPGEGDYAKWSDAEIEGFVALYPDSLNFAVGSAYMGLAAQAALVSQSIADYDLRIDTTKRSQSLIDIANFYFGQAALVDGTQEYFDIVQTGVSWPQLPAELAEWEWPYAPWSVN